MFVIMGYPSRSLLSGQLAMGAGTLCLLLALGLWYRTRTGKLEKTRETAFSELNN